MGHTFYQHYGHLVFRADGVPIRSEDLPRLHAYLGGVARNLRIQAPIIGGTENHVHLLGNFPVTMTIADIVRDLKTSSSHWLHTQHKCYEGFAWNQGYGYFSVSASSFARVADYIRHQPEHHARMTTAEEYSRLIQKHTQSSLHQPD